MANESVHGKFKKGHRVRHVGKPEWGMAQVLQDEAGEALHLFFECVGEMRIATSAREKLVLLLGSAAHNKLLDHLHLSQPGKSRPTVTIEQAKTRLLEIFPGGLHGARMQQEERAYKDALIERARALFPAQELTKLLEEGEYGAILGRARQFIADKLNNFPATFEKIAFRNGVADCNRERELARAFCAWVLPPTADKVAFESFAAELDRIGCAKWPIATIFRFMMHPKSDVLIKPENLQNAAELARFEINYQPHLNWKTYASVLTFYEVVKERIADLEPHDMVDVQNFIWCIQEHQ